MTTDSRRAGRLRAQERASASQAPGVLGVCGFGRCGTTMIMTMLHAGGVEPAAGTMAGSYELRLGPDGAIAVPDVDGLTGRAVKLLNHVQHFPLPHPELRWGFVWLDRTRIEQARSMVKLLNHNQPRTAHPTAIFKFARSYSDDRPALLKRLQQHGPVAIASFEKTLEDPTSTAELLRGLVADLHGVDAGDRFDVAAAAAAVHDRDPACRPDMYVELLLSRERALR